MAKVYFRGFSTKDKSHKTNKLNDIELVKRDLLNHFHTRLGERVMHPAFGSIIWDMIFEPFTESNKDIIIEDATRVVTSETRVVLQNMIVEELEHGLRIQMDLFFRPQNVAESFAIDFDKRLAERI